jgi:hypothetical protein
MNAFVDVTCCLLVVEEGFLDSVSTTGAAPRGATALATD